MNTTKLEKLLKQLPRYDLAVFFSLLGILMIIIGQLFIFLKIQPFAMMYCPIIWYGYIFLIDGIVYIFKGNSLIINKTKRFIILTTLSFGFWLIFEFYNEFLGGWYYANLPEPHFLARIIGYLCFSSIVPAVFETADLIKQLHIFKEMRIHMPVNIILIYSLIAIGLICLIIPYFFPSPYMWMFVWTGFILLLDPISYLFHNEKSIIMLIKKRKLNTILSLFVAGYICGFLWEFWNYWAYTKWYYTVPILENIKIFEIPVLGFLAYGPFAWELYVMYNFVKMLLSKKGLLKALT